MCKSPSSVAPSSYSPQAVLAGGVGGPLSALGTGSIDANTAKGGSMLGALFGLGGHVGYMLGGTKEAKEKQKQLLWAQQAERARFLAEAEEKKRKASADAAAAQRASQQAALRASPPTRSGQAPTMGSRTGTQGVQDVLLTLGKTKLGA